MKAIQCQISKMGRSQPAWGRCRRAVAVNIAVGKQVAVGEQNLSQRRRAMVLTLLEMRIQDTVL